MTVLATTVRCRPASHAFTVPVVRELAPQSTQLATGSAWQAAAQRTGRRRVVAAAARWCGRTLAAQRSAVPAGR